MTQGLRFGPLGERAVHLCVDMQQMFDAGTPWATGWLRKVLAQVVRLCEARPERTIFTRFIPAQSSDGAHGAWRRYYRQYEEMTRRQIEPRLLELIPELGQFVPPARIIDKSTYSPWPGTGLLESLHSVRTDTIIVSGGETDVCVLGTVLGAVDAEFRVIVATDALCSSVNETHDAIINFYHERLSAQIEAAQIEEILDFWKSYACRVPR
jgi:nicotinamidase-related amidase